MSTISWLHLSDLHFEAKEKSTWDANVVLKELLVDLQGPVRQQYGLSLDLILVTGDIASSGAHDEYLLAQKFFDSLLEVTNLPKERLFIVPGNHDVSRKDICPEAKKIISSLGSRKSREAVNSILADGPNLSLVLHKFDAYNNFVNTYLGGNIPFGSENYFFVHSLNLDSKKIAILGLNSAWAAFGGRKDRGKLILGERQVSDALERSRDADLCIALLHHPFDWLHEFDRESCEAQLMDRCDFILRGHLHRAELVMHITPDARAMTVAAGACYESREYRNGYNLVRFDLERREGTIFLRAWSDSRNGFWTKDTSSYKNVANGEYPFSLNEYHSFIPQGGDTLQSIEEEFSRHTNQAIRQIRDLIPGISDPLPRDEVSLIEDQISLGKSVTLTGEAGTGKSGIASQLVKSAKGKGIITLLLDARNVGRIQNETQMQQYFRLNGSFHAAIKQAGRFKKCRVIIDQIDSIAGSLSANLLIELALELTQFQGVELIFISRKREDNEVRALDRLTSNNGFIELISHPLSEPESMRALSQIGISNPSPTLISLGCNLLNLSLIGNIREKDPAFDCSFLVNEVDLWDQYLQVLQNREDNGYGSGNAEAIIAEAIRLAREGLKNRQRTFCLDYPRPRQQSRLISWGIIIGSGNDRIYRFYHEKFQDFLYAWDATQRNLMPQAVLTEIDEHMSRNVLVWMQKIYKRQDSQIYKQFLKEVLL